MRLLPVILAAAFLIGCQTAPPDYRALTERFADGEDIAPAKLRTAFLQAPDLPGRMERLNDLEAQALAVVEDEPLKLGSIGSAIIDTYVGSLTGHYVLARFYDHVSNPKADFHWDWVERIRADMEAAGAGSRDDPYPAVTPVEARIYALSKNLSPVGSIYQTDGVPFSLLLQVRPEEGALRNVVFDLTGLYDSMRKDFDDSRRAAEAAPEAPEPPADGDRQTEDKPAARRQAEFTPLTLIGYLAKQQDSAAQTAVGAFLARENRFDDAVDWLRSASRTGNLLANSLLARIYWERARVAATDEAREAAMDKVMENYLHAIALGSAEAMYALGVLYLNGHYGDENKVSGVSLLKQASELEHSESTMFLAHLHYSGEVVDKDLDRARSYYARAAELGNAFARNSYARFLLDRSADQPGDPRAVDWLRELADDGEAESMLLLGNLHARGVGTDHDVRRAVHWFKQAVEQAPDDANIVNEVAWTLTVSDQQALRRARYARRIMDQLMEENAEARQRPEYLDTWAATYAANGDFERAVTLQRQALDVARSADYADVLEILEAHLEAFHDGRTISESVP